MIMIMIIMIIVIMMIIINIIITILIISTIKMITVIITMMIIISRQHVYIMAAATAGTVTDILYGEPGVLHTHACPAGAGLRRAVDKYVYFVKP